MPDPPVTAADPHAVRRGPRAWPVLAVVCAGGVLGSVARYGLAEAFPHRPGSFGWVTFGINVSGCLLIGVLMALLTEVWTDLRLLRPFVGAGVLGGFTTFSAYVLDVQQAVSTGAAATGLLYLAATMACALVAVWAGATVTGQAVRCRTRAGRRGRAGEPARTSDSVAAVRTGAGREETR